MTSLTLGDGFPLLRYSLERTPMTIPLTTTTITITMAIIVNITTVAA
jgi:hypothetical protein